jgi:hypothetical protein
MKCTIDTDLTNAGTTICIDGEECCKTKNVTDISFYAYAANKKYNESGHVAVSVTSFDAEGNRKREYYTKDDNVAATDYMGIGMNTTDGITIDKSDIISYIGNGVILDDTDEKAILVDSIIEHCVNNKILCADKEMLMKRSFESLQDKITDLGISSEGA